MRLTQALVVILVLVVTPRMARLEEDLTKHVTITGTGFLYYKNTGELTNVHFSVSHRLSRPVTAMLFALTFRSPSGVVLKTDRYRQQFQWEYQSKLFGTPLATGEVYQVQYSVSPHVQGFCPSACGTAQVRVLAVETE